MSAKSTFILMLLFLVLGSFAIFDPFQLKEKKETQKEREGHIFWLKDKKAENLYIKNGDILIRLVCELPEGCSFDSSGKWNILHPVQDKADNETVNSVITSLQNLGPVDKIDLQAQPDQKEFRFDKSDLEISFKLKDEKEPILMKFGSATPVGPNTYAEISNELHRVYIVANYFPAQFKKDVFHWRNKRLFPETMAAKIGQISWKGMKQKISAIKKDGYWFLESPIQAKGSFTMLEGLANTLELITAKTLFSDSVNTEAAKKVLPTKPILELEFGLPGKMEKLTIFRTPSNAPGFYVAHVKGREPLYLVDSRPFERFEKELVEYRDRRLVPYEAVSKTDEISLEFPRDNKKITLKKTGANWEYISGDKPEEALSQKRIELIVDELVNAEASSFLKSPAKVSLFARLVDLRVVLRADSRDLSSMRFVLDSKNSVITAGDFPDEVKVLGGDFLKALPIRFDNLYESANKQVVTVPKVEAVEVEMKGDHHGHSH